MAIHQLYVLLLMASVYFVVCLEKTSSTTESLSNYGEKTLCKQPNLPHSLDRMQHGVDLTSLNLFRKHDQKHDDGFREKVILFTCSEGNTWKHQEVPDAYDIPDDVADINGLTTSELYLTISVIKNTDEYKTNVRAQSDASVEMDTVGSFSRSYAFEYANQKIYVEKKTITEIKGFASSFDVLLKKPEKLNLNPEFVKDYQDLKHESCNAHNSRCENFISTYGTHYIAGAEFGGKVEQRIEVNSKFTSENNAEELYLNSAGSLAKYLKAKNELNVSHSHLTESFLENTIREFIVFGGVQNSDSDVLVDTDWIRSVFKSPRCVKVSLRPISDLIPDHEISREVYKSIVANGVLASYEELLATWKISIENKTYEWSSGYNENIEKLRRKFIDFEVEFSSNWGFTGDLDSAIIRKPQEILNELNVLIDNNSVCYEWMTIIIFRNKRKNNCENKCFWKICCFAMHSAEFALDKLHSRIDDVLYDNFCSRYLNPEEMERLKRLFHHFKMNHMIGQDETCCFP